MTAPGDSLEFQASSFFRLRAAQSPGLTESIKELLRRAPDTGDPLCPGIRKVGIEMAGEALVVFVARRGNRVSLMYVYQAFELKLIKAKEDELLRLYGKGGLV
jgi:hypothetical protein